mgnify:CR=1 FL=1
MKEYNPVTAEVIDALKAVVGDKYVKTDADVLDIYKSDESLAPSFWKTPEVVVLPANTQEVSEIMKIANRFDVPVTPRSAGTSVSCGAVPAYKGIVLLMERMNHIIELNEDGMYMTVEAGVRTIDIQNAAREKGLLYAGDPAAPTAASSAATWLPTLAATKPFAMARRAIRSILSKLSCRRAKSSTSALL